MKPRCLHWDWIQPWSLLLYLLIHMLACTLDSAAPVSIEILVNIISLNIPGSCSLYLGRYAQHTAYQFSHICNHSLSVEPLSDPFMCLCDTKVSGDCI